MEKLLCLVDEINELSNRYYELIPHQNYTNEALTPINNANILAKKYNQINDLIDFEITSKILLGLISYNIS